MKKIIAICGGILAVSAVVTATIAIIDYKMEHRRYVRANIKLREE